MISFHLNTRDIHLHYLYSDFRIGNDAGNPSFIARAICMCVNSPIIWKEGKRKAKNFDFADWMVLDFDDGLEIEKAKEIFSHYTHVIATTKSHQKEKGKEKKVCDRFRVWIKLMVRCNNLDQYTYNTKILAERYGADCQAIDGARKYLPCKSVYSFGKGKLLTLKPYIKPQPKKIKTPHEIPHKFIPAFIRNMLDNGVPEGQRNYACYTIAKYLNNNGFSKSEIFSIIMNSAVPSNHKCGREVESAIRNGCAA